MANLQAWLATSCLTLCWLLGVEGFGHHRTAPEVQGPGEEQGAPGAGKQTGHISAAASHNSMLKHLSPKQDISSCEVYTSHGQCQFYACLDDLLDCAGAKHKRMLMHKFCNRAKHHSELFTAEGISWARNTNKCVMKKLMAAYSTKNKATSLCGQVDSLAHEAFVDCAASEGVCSALGTDRTALAKIFTSGSWMTVVEAARDCAPAQVNQFIFWNLDNMHLHH